MAHVRWLVAAMTCAAAACTDDSLSAAENSIPWDRITGQITYTGDSGAYVLDGSTRTVRRLYTDGHGAGFPGLMWSKQGDRLMLSHLPVAFVVGQPVGGGLLTEVSAGGTVLRALGSAADDLCCAAYAADGRAAYLNHYSELWVDGALALANVVTNSRPVWTPDSRYVLVSSGGISGTNQLNRVDLATGARTLAFPQAPGQYIDPVYSPDGARMAFVRGEPDVFGLFQIWTIAADGTDPRQLSRSNTDASPSWSPDGTQIVFVRRNIGRGEYGFAIMRADGSDVVEFQVPRDASIAPHVSWRP